MEGSSPSEELQLCEGCYSLQLETRLLPRRSSGAPLERMSIKLNPDQCRLCSLINKWLLRLGLETYTTPGSGKAFEPLLGTGTSDKKTSDGCSEVVRRFDALLASSRQITIVRFWPCMFPVPSLRRLCDTNYRQALSFPTGRLIEPLVDVRLFRHWMRLCSRLHGDACSRPTWVMAEDDIPFNFRLIDVKAGCIVDSPVKPLYFILSYVWGPSKNDLCATKSNIDDLKKPHSLNQKLLPQTILDAMNLVSDLGVKYLWVDRLCILQDDDNDKSIQIPQMDIIYSLAELTIIAASGSSAHEGIAGLSTSRKVDQDICPISSKVALMTIPLENKFPIYTYSSRGWTQQERILSRRVLMFTEGQAFWSCSCADWTERFCLEPSSLGFEDSPWEVPRVLLGSYERGEFYRDFSREQYSTLPRFYALKSFTNESDALDAIAGLLRRISRVTGDDFYWGHNLCCFFDQSLSWRKSKIELARRKAMAPIRGVASSYYVPFPSWSWLGWKAAIKFVLDLQLISVPGARLIPEIDFYHLDINGRVKRLVQPAANVDSTLVDYSRLLRNGSSGSWKSDTYLANHDFPKDVPFKDSGRLVFWTSHAELSIKAEPRVRLGCVRLKIVSSDGVKVGQIDELTLASDHGMAWPFIKYDESVLQSIIVISRKYKKESHQGIQILAAQPILNVMWVNWEGVEKKTASRISVGEVSEQAWIDVKRDWRLVTLQ
jgi:Heterokaryon incompatibility protein (HET)